MSSQNFKKFGGHRHKIIIFISHDQLWTLSRWCQRSFIFKPLCNWVECCTFCPFLQHPYHGARRSFFHFESHFTAAETSRRRTKSLARHSTHLQWNAQCRSAKHTVSGKVFATRRRRSRSRLSSSYSNRAGAGEFGSFVTRVLFLLPWLLGISACFFKKANMLW